MITRNGIEDYLFAIALADGRYTSALSLARHYGQIYSQNGEDGVITEIFRRIGARDRRFVEIGVETGQQNNTRFLLEQGWRGVWVDCGKASLLVARETFSSFVESGRLKIVEAVVTAGNINSLLEQTGMPQSFDFLSLDVDQNTSHVWRSMRARARVVCIEYNASIPASIALEVPYDQEGCWDGTNWYGASLKALENIGRAKGLSLVGCELNGVNAFFVDESEAFEKFLGPFTSERHWEPPRYAQVRHIGHPASADARLWSSD